MAKKFPIILFAILAACASAQKNSQEMTQSPVEKYKSLAESKYSKDSIEYSFNLSKTHVLCLCQKKATSQTTQNSVRFFLYDLKANEIILEDAYPDGLVKWANDDQLRIIRNPEIVTTKEGDGSRTYIFDIKTQKKIFPNVKEN